MPNSLEPRWVLRTAAAPLLLSLALHGLLFLTLWFWPMRAHGPALTIESTRITLDACVLDSGAPTLLPTPELPAEFRGQAVDIALAPRIEALPASQKQPDASRSQAEIGNAGEQSAASRPASASDQEAELAGRRSQPELGNEGNDGSGNLFPLPATASSVVYVLDRSLTMGIDRKLDFARRELIASLRRLPPGVSFQVIDYNDHAETLIVDGRRGLLPAEPTIVEKTAALLQAFGAAGGTNHLAALRRGLDLHPDVLFFLTDADDLKPEVISFITQRYRRTVIHTVELTRVRSPRPEGPLAQLARDNHGTYRRVAVGD